MAIGAGVAGKVNEHQLVLGARLGQRLAGIDFSTKLAQCFLPLADANIVLFGLHRDKRLDIAERGAEKPRQQAEWKNQEQRR